MSRKWSEVKCKGHRAMGRGSEMESRVSQTPMCTQARGSCWNADFDFLNLGWGLTSCSSDKPLADADATSPQTTPWGARKAPKPKIQGFGLSAALSVRGCKIWTKSENFPEPQTLFFHRDFVWLTSKTLSSLKKKIIIYDLVSDIWPKHFEDLEEKRSVNSVHYGY